MVELRIKIISIHALREEGDLGPSRSSLPGCRYFYPRPPRGGRLAGGRDDRAAGKFLSTPSARRATRRSLPKRPTTTISIHALREEGDQCSCRAQRRRRISIHALREEGDFFLAHKDGNALNFYPRPPRGGRRRLIRQWQLLHRNFYPRPPRGGRRRTARFRRMGGLFLSTPSARRATQQPTTVLCRLLFLSTPSARRATGTP